MKPPPFAIWGSIQGAADAGTISFVGGVVLIRKSPRSLYRPRNAATTTVEPAVLTRKTPLTGKLIPGKTSSRNLAICPLPGTTIEVLASGLPLRSVRSKLTVAEAHRHSPVQHRC